MKDQILTVKEIAAQRIVPLSETTLLRAAREGDGPFHKVRGRWMASESDLRSWVRGGRRGKSNGTVAGDLLERMRKGAA